jgi:citrate lyase subunit gamma (acyl carrier protein)
MDIKKIATAGTLESSDAQVLIEPGNVSLEIEVKSSVIKLFGRQIRKVAQETLQRLGVDNAKVTITDRGALDCTIKARVETAVYRSAGQTDQFPWGGAIR